MYPKARKTLTIIDAREGLLRASRQGWVINTKAHSLDLPHNNPFTGLVYIQKDGDLIGVFV